jgi:hypothetical protein
MADKSWRVRKIDDRIEFSVRQGGDQFILTLPVDQAIDIFERCLAVAEGRTLGAGADQ